MDDERELENINREAEWFWRYRYLISVLAGTALVLAFVFVLDGSIVQGLFYFMFFVVVVINLRVVRTEVVLCRLYRRLAKNGKTASPSESADFEKPKDSDDE